MAFIEGIGAPTLTTAGAIGDIYKDKENGKEYKCTFSYKSSHDILHYDWEESKTVTRNKVVMEPKEEFHKEEEPVTKKETPIKEEIKRKDYTSYGKKNHSK